MDKALERLLPRMPAPQAILILGSYADKPGFVQFLLDAKELGFGLEQPGDKDLDEEKWKEISTNRVRALCMSYDNSVISKQTVDGEFHVVIVGRAGQNAGTDIYLIGPGSKKDAIKTGEVNFRKAKSLPTSVALSSHIGFTGNAEDGESFIKKVMELIDEGANQ